MLASLPSVTCTSLPRCHELLTRCFLCLLMLINNWTPVKISSFSDLGYWNPLVFSGSPNFVNFGLFFWTVFFFVFPGYISSTSSPYKTIKPSGARDALGGTVTPGPGNGSGELPPVAPIDFDIDSGKTRRCPVRLASRAVLSHLVSFFVASNPCLGIENCFNKDHSNQLTLCP